MKVHKEGKTILLTIGGVTQNLYQWGKQYGIKEETLRYRVAKGWDEKDLFMKPHGAGRLKSTIEMRKRGCHYCADFNRSCPHDKCPYHELDEFKTYDEYMRKSEKNGLVKLLEELG